MPKITKTNYFTPNNKTLTNSKLGDFAKDPNYFFKKHILGDIKQEITDPLIIGSAVDEWLTNKESSFKKKYYVVTRRNTKAPDYRYQLTPTMAKEIEGVCRRVEATTAFKQIKGYTAQRILQVDNNDLGEHFDKIAGIPDFYKIVGDHAIIIDLKTARTVDEKKYHYHCLEYGYYRQQAIYQYLIRENYLEVKTIESFHLVVEKDARGIYPVKTFRLGQEAIDREADYIREQLLPKLKIEKYFHPQDCSFDEPIEIGKLGESF